MGGDVGLSLYYLFAHEFHELALSLTNLLKPGLALIMTPRPKEIPWNYLGNGKRCIHRGTNAEVRLASDITRNASCKAMHPSAVRAGSAQLNEKPNPHFVMIRSATWYRAR